MTFSSTGLFHGLTSMKVLPMNNKEPSRNRFRPIILWEYIRTRYPLTLYGYYAIVWYLALAGTFAGAKGLLGGWVFSWGDAAAMITVLGLFFFMRTIDEVKDLEYDRIYKPDRILVQGKITVFEMCVYAAITAAILITINIFLSWKLTLIATLIMSYSVFLLWLERAWPGMKKLPLYLSTAIAIQLKTGAVVYVYFTNSVIHNGAAAWHDALLILSFVLAYFHWETGRKIALPRFAEPGEELYSNHTGVVGSIIISALFLIGPSIVIVGRLKPFEKDGLVFVAGAVLLLCFVPFVVGSIFVPVWKEKRFPLKPFSTVSYAVLFIISIILISHKTATATWIAIGSFSLFIFELKPVSDVFKRTYKWINHQIEKTESRA